jgi:hypothetical protein
VYPVDFELTTLLFTTFLMGEEVRKKDSNYIFYNIKDNMG